MPPSKTPTLPLTKNRRPARLAAHLDKGLLGYAAAASAAGVGLLALAQPAEAKILYTPSNVPIPVNGGLVQFDINHDGVPDFGFSNVSYFGRPRAARAPLGLYHDSLRVIPAQASNEVRFLSSKGFPCAARLRAGVAVGPGNQFEPNPDFMFQVSGDATNQFNAHCPWLDSKGGFLGLKFVVNGETHYGWARVSMIGGVSLRGYAYETVPNRPILTGATKGPDDDASLSSPPALSSPDPQPTSLGLLAHGASALAVWRRPEEMN